jgi:CRP-like cAMP-binding protein
MARSPDRKIEALQGVWLFSTCTKKELRQLAAICERVNVPEGEAIVREGDPGRDFYVLLDGTAEATSGGAVLNRLGPGDFFGELALLDGGPRSATVTTTSPADLILMSRSDFNALVTEEAPSVAPKMLAMLGGRLREVSSQLVAARSHLGSM